jgi:isoleucyl-tRNA synthetase
VAAGGHGSEAEVSGSEGEATGAGAALRDEALEAEMAAARQLVSLGRAAREEVRIRVRQPLGRMRAVVPGGVRLRDEILAVVKEELNVKEVAFLADAEGLVELVAKPNYRALGPRWGKATNDAATVIRGLGQDALERFRAGAAVEITVGDRSAVLGPEDLEVVEEARGSWAVKAEAGHVAALDPQLTPELAREGTARELINRIQRLRRDTGLEITDRIRLAIFGPEQVREAAREWGDFIAGEVLASEHVVHPLEAAPKPNGDEDATPAGEWEGVQEADLDGTPAVVALRRTGSTTG